MIVMMLSFLLCINGLAVTSISIVDEHLSARMRNLPTH